MKLVIKILFCVLLLVLLVTSLVFVVLYPQWKADDAKDDIFGSSLTLVFALMGYVTIVFMEIELFFGLKCFLLGIVSKKTVVIVFSALLILLVLANGIILSLFVTGNYNIDYFHHLEIVTLTLPIGIIIFNLILFLVSKKKREK